jgi:DNA-binding transcriptional LysR family regulator
VAPNLRSVDTKLLIVFDAILREGSMTRAARFVGMSQPAISNALRKLRHIFRDELFVRIPGGVRPTLRSQELAPLIREVLALLQAAIDPVAFDPGTSTHTFHIAAGDHSAILILPELLHRLQLHAPGMKLRTRPKRDYLFVSELDSGDVHFVMGLLDSLPKRIQRASLFRDSYVCLMRPSHPLAGKPLSLDDFLAADHLEMSHPGDISSLLDRELARKGLERTISMTINQSILAPSILNSCDVVMTTFAKLARLPAYQGLRMQPVPFEIPPVEAQLAWPGTLEAHPAQRWLKDQIVDICRQFR